MREKLTKAVRVLLWAAACLTAFPVLAMLAMLAVFGLTLAGGYADGVTALFVAQLLCAAAILTVTMLRLRRRKTPAWLWALLSAAMTGLTVTLVIQGLNDPKAGVAIGLVLIPAMGILAVLGLNGLLQLLTLGQQEETVLPPSTVQEEWPLRLVRWTLAVLCAGGACAAAYWVVTLYALFGSPTVLPERMGCILCEEGAALFGYGVTALSILRLMKRWCRPWAFVACATAYAALLTVACCMGGALRSSWGAELAAIQLGYVLALLGLNDLWWALEHKQKKTEESK